MQAARRTAKPVPFATIEGEATVLERSRPASPAAAEAPAFRLAPEPTNDNRLEADAVFLRRPQHPDLVFQGRMSALKGQAEVPAPRPFDAALDALGTRSGRNRAAVAMMMACLASLAAWSAPDMPSHDQTATAPRSTPERASATGDGTSSVPNGGKTDRIIVKR